MKYSYKPRGICAYLIEFELDEGIVHDVIFHGGCTGNTAGICRLAEGMAADDVIARLKGIDCDGKGTSCPDRLAAAVEEALTAE